MPEPSRRQFLGAAAAVATLPLPSEMTGGDEAPDYPAPPEEYTRRAVASTVGGLEYYPPLLATTEVAVNSCIDEVGLYLISDQGEAYASLLPEDVDALIAELRAAKARLIPEEVEWAREDIENLERDR